MKTTYKVALVILASVGMTFSAFGQEAKKEAPKKVDVKNLEKRYWAPKDKKFKVVQNRTYTKTNKFFLSVMPSLMLNEEYSKGFGTDIALGYFFNDRWGLELEYQTMSLDDNDLQNEVIKLEGFANHGKSTGYYGVSGRWMPFYAKMSFLGTKIVYFDLSLGLSVGMMSYEQQFNGGEPAVVAAIANQNLDKTSVAYGFDVSQSFYMSRKLLLRFDYKHRFYNQEIIVGGTTSPGSPAGDRNEDSISLNLGLTYIF